MERTSPRFFAGPRSTSTRSCAASTPRACRSSSPPTSSSSSTARRRKRSASPFRPRSRRASRRGLVERRCTSDHGNPMTRGLSRRGVLRAFASLSAAALVQSCAPTAVPNGVRVKRIGYLGGGVAAQIAKQVEFLKAVVPNLKRISVLWNANNPGAAIQLGDIEEGARALDVRIDAFAIHDAQELSQALEKIATSLPDGLLIAPAFNIAFDVKLISNFAIDAKLPHVFSSDLPWAAAGGLMEIGANSAAEMQRAAVFVDKILRGARPADLPVELPTKFRSEERRVGKESKCGV